MNGTHLKLKKTLLECSQKLFRGSLGFDPPGVGRTITHSLRLVSSKFVKKKHTLVESKIVCSVPKKSRGMATMILLVLLDGFWVCPNTPTNEF